jgi:hypothetical protein
MVLPMSLNQLFPVVLIAAEAVEDSENADLLLAEKLN